MTLDPSCLAGIAYANPAVNVPPLVIPEVNEWLMLTGLVAIVLDIIFGVANAAAKHEISSAKMRAGLWHKVAYLGAWGVAWIFAFAMCYADLGFQVPTVDAVSIYILVMEGVSCLENICKLNPDFAGSGLMKMFAGLKDQAKNEEGKEKDDAEH